MSCHTPGHNHAAGLVMPGPAPRSLRRRAAALAGRAAWAGSKAAYRRRVTDAPVWAGAATLGAAEVVHYAGPWPALAVAGAGGAAAWAWMLRRARSGRRRLALTGGTQAALLSAAAMVPPHTPGWLAVWGAATGTALWAWRPTTRKPTGDAAWWAEHWQAYALSMGMPTLRLMAVKETPAGWELRVVGIPGDVPSKKLDADRCASTFHVERGKVTIQQGRTARHAIINITMRDPWVDVDNRHPATVGAGAWASPSRTVADPLPFAIHADGRVVSLPLWSREGAEFILVAGRRGMGKSNGINALIASAAACRDVDVWLVDVAKFGVEGKTWGGVVGRTAATHEQALRMLRDARDLARRRSAGQADRAERGENPKWEPSPDDPLIFLIVDEGKSVFMPSDAGLHAIGDEATQVLEELAREARSGGVALLVGTQRPTVDAFGGAPTTRSQVTTAVSFYFRSPSDSMFVLGEESPIPVNTLERGQCVISTGEQIMTEAPRAYAMHEAGEIRAIASRYAGQRPSRTHTPSVSPVGEEHTIHAPEPEPGEATPATWSEAKEYLARKRAEAPEDIPSEQLLAELATEEAEQYRQEAAKRYRPATRRAHVPFLTLLAGHPGISPADIGQRLGLGKTVVWTRLSELRELGLVVFEGTTRDRRVRLADDPGDSFANESTQ